LLKLVRLTRRSWLSGSGRSGARKRVKATADFEPLGVVQELRAGQHFQQVAPCTTPSRWVAERDSYVEIVQLGVNRP
jgi:hypothetical protein